MYRIRKPSVIKTYPLGPPEDVPLDLTPEEAKNRGVMYAERPEWQDLPDWGDRTDCPLLDLLHEEVLDEIFGLPSSLMISDYLALAGTCKFFREHLGERFFEALLRDRQKEDRYLNLFGATPRDIKARHPFTEPSVNHDSGPGMPQYRKTLEERRAPSEDFIDDSEEEDWTEEAYLRHRAEKTQWKLMVLQWNDDRQAEAGFTRDAPYGRALNRYFRVRGLSHGSAAIRTGYTFHTEGVSEAIQKRESKVFAAREDEYMRDLVVAELKRDEAAKAYEEYTRAQVEKSAADHDLLPSQEWSGIDWEKDSDVEIEDYSINTGKRIRDDYASSAWRRIAAAAVTSCAAQISKRRAIETYKVSRAQLLTLKSFVMFCSTDPVYIDPRVEVYAHWDDCNCPPISHCDLQFYHEASVRALALRAHGGPLGHAKHRSDAKADMPPKGVNPLHPGFEKDLFAAGYEQKEALVNGATEQHDPAEAAEGADKPDLTPDGERAQQSETSASPGEENMLEQTFAGDSAGEIKGSVEEKGEKDASEDPGATMQVEHASPLEAVDEKVEPQVSTAPVSVELSQTPAAVNESAELCKLEEGKEGEDGSEPPAKKSKTSHDA